MDIYAENILDHYRNPRHRGKMKNVAFRAEDSNPVCGDRVAIGIKTDKNGVIRDASFIGEGCAISQAAASMLLEKIIGKKAETAKKITLKDVCRFLGVPLTPVRMKCAQLSLDVLKKALVKCVSW